MPSREIDLARVRSAPDRAGRRLARLTDYLQVNWADIVRKKTGFDVADQRQVDRLLRLRGLRRTLMLHAYLGEVRRRHGLPPKQAFAANRLEAVREWLRTESALEPPEQKRIERFSSRPHLRAFEGVYERLSPLKPSESRRRLELLHKSLRRLEMPSNNRLPKFEAALKSQRIRASLRLLLRSRWVTSYPWNAKRRRSFPWPRPAREERCVFWDYAMLDLLKFLRAKNLGPRDRPTVIFFMLAIICPEVWGRFTKTPRWFRRRCIIVEKNRALPKIALPFLDEKNG